MNSSQKPRLAEWLLSNFGCSANNDAIIGDINQRYQQGRSPIWYWKQVFFALIAGLSKEIRSNGFLTCRVLLIGWSLAFLVSRNLPALVYALRGDPRGTGLLPESWIVVRWSYVRGWIVLAADAYVVVLVVCIVAFGIGWLLGRLHRPHQRMAILIMVTSWMLCLIPMFMVMMGRAVSDWSATYWRYDNPYFLVFGTAANIAAMLSLAAGGLRSEPKTRPQVVK